MGGMVFWNISQTLYTYIGIGVLRTMKLKCRRCGYAWEYGGKAPFYTSCPRCKTNVKTNGEIKDGKNKEVKR